MNNSSIKPASGTLYIVSAPSGAGKSSLIKAYLQSQPAHQATVAISHTTRAARPGENHGEHYYFVDKLTFEKMITAQAFVEYAQVYDNYYGTSLMAIESSLQHGIDVFLDIDWQGAKQVRQLRPDARSIFILPPSLTELERRLIQRGQDSQEVIARRMQQAKAEMSHYSDYDYLIINDDFTTSLQQLSTIMQAERLTCHKQQQHHQALLAALLA